MPPVERLAAVNRIVIHCAATRPGQNVDDDDIKRWHTDRGFLDIGYHNVIKLDGTIQYGRSYDEKGAHVRGHNDDSVGVCLVGGLDEAGQPAAYYTPEQWASLDRLVAWLQIMWPRAHVVGHNQLDSGKACPSFSVPIWNDSRRKV